MTKIYNFNDFDLIKNGDNLLVHSDLINIINTLRKKKLKFNPDKFINNLKKKIGKNGSIVFPTYNFDFCKKKNFNSNNKFLTTGFLPKYALSRKDFIRSRHPIISFTISGLLKDEFCEIDSRSAFGENSVFNFMVKKNFKIIFIDLDYKKSFSFIHHFEELSGITYRFKKKFRGLYTYNNEAPKIKTYELFVKYMNSNKHTYPNEKLKSILMNKNIFYERLYNGVKFQVIDIKKSKKIIMSQIKHDKFYHTVTTKKFKKIFNIK